MGTTNGSRRTPRIRVFAADPHLLFGREVLAAVVKERPELQLVGLAADGREALAEIRRLRPDVALLDSGLPDLGVAEVLGAVQRERLPTRVIMFTHGPGPSVYRALASGAAGLLTKAADDVQICNAITAAARGKTVLASELQGAVAAEIRLRNDDDRPFLTDREYQVLRLTAEGRTAPEIASELILSTGTIKTHLQHLYDKLGVRERAAAVAAAMRRGLLE